MANEPKVRETCPNCFGAGCFVCLPEFSTNEPDENDPELSEEQAHDERE